MIVHYPDSHYEGNPPSIHRRLVRELLNVEAINTGEWQSMDTSGSTLHYTHELLDVVIDTPVPRCVPDWQTIAQPDLPWAEVHFLERVSGQPLNPAPSHVDWPFAIRGNEDHTQEGAFDHTYPERFWPRFANVGNVAANGRQIYVPHMGIRFEYGDLRDVVQLLAKFPGTRQAFLPVWFPEDTGGHLLGEKRVPCTLGYHFMIRYGILSMRYYLRSCDVRRHFLNDIYMAGRFQQWMVHEILMNGGPPTIPGSLRVYISSLHAFTGDDSYLRGIITP